MTPQPIPIHTVVMYPRPHPDNIVALFLLREFGVDAFPGIKEAQMQFWPALPAGKTTDGLEREGVLLIDLGGGRFDHHHEEHTDDKTTCATTLVADYLGIRELPELKKLLEYVRRDDLEGKGIVSKDPIDRAFGLSAIIMNLNRDYPQHPEYVVDLVTRIFAAHYHEEYRRKVLIPKEWEQLQQNGLATIIKIPSQGRTLTVVFIQSDSKALVGYLRAVGTVQADVVVQRLSGGHTNIVTRQIDPRLNLLRTVATLRKAEAAKKGLPLAGITREQLEKPRRLEGIDEWYFDTAANTIQNGGAVLAEIHPTQLSLDEIREILVATLPESVPQPSARPIRREDGPHVIRFADLRRRPRNFSNPDDREKRGEPLDT